jgi:hypothetical protein
MLLGPLRFLLGGRLTGVVVVGTVAGVLAADVLVPGVACRVRRVLFVVAGVEALVVGVSPVLVVLVVLGPVPAAALEGVLAVTLGGLVEPQPHIPGATRISMSHLRIRGRLPRGWGCEHHRCG